MTVWDQLLSTVNSYILLALPANQDTDLLIIADGQFWYDKHGNKLKNGEVPINLIAQYTYRFSKDQQEHQLLWVKSWDEAKQVLKKFNKIGKLILFPRHGESGQVQWGQKVDYIDEIIKIGDKLPQIDIVEVGVCAVASNATRVFQFLQQTKANQVIAWNLYRVFEPRQIPKGITQGKFEENFGKYRGYFIEGTPPEEDLVNSKQDRYVLAEWFRKESDDSPLSQYPDTKTYKMRSRMRPEQFLTISDEETAKEYTQDQEVPTDHDLNQVTFKLP